MFLALARDKALPIMEEVKRLPLQPKTGQWLNFLRHHDELTLDKLTDEERNEVFSAFAPDEDMRIFDTGIRRRLAPMLNNDRRKMEMVHSMIFSFPGIPMVRYGDEIGMGEDLSLFGRSSVRTAMQWNNSKNGGFSSADPQNLAMPVISDGAYSYEKVNVGKQYDDKNSFLNFVRKLVSLRKQCHEIGEGTFSIMDHDDPGLLIHRFEGKDNNFIAIHNLTERSIKLNKDMNSKETKMILSENNEIDLNLISPYGYRWLLTKK
jgi:maltose alpha-D-glucosyltransferase/alpha-amylase